MVKSNHYHEGELAVQERAGERESGRRSGAVLYTSIPAGALHFIAEQPMVVIGSLDPKGCVWTSMLFGQPGFIRALDNQTLEIDTSQPRSAPDDPFWINIEKNSKVGLLLIDLGSRRRLRVNGHIRRLSEERMVMTVELAYPNCPKYIQRRQWKPVSKEQIHDPQSKSGVLLNETQKSWITSADTLFVASAHPKHGLDASHRGGYPGFVQLINETTLRIPDFTGNGMFNTLGNFTSYPYAGIAFIDFDNARLLQLSGRAEILWDVDDSKEETGGTRRYWQLELLGWLENPLPIAMAWEFLDYSPLIPQQRNEFG